MFILIGALLVLAIIAALSMFISSKKEEDSEEIVAPDEECCGAHEVCEVDLSKLSEEIVYFEDEELDTFQNRAASGYSDEEIEMFRDVLYTLKKKEINEWLRSLELRKIIIPDILKSEIIMLLAE